MILCSAVIALDDALLLTPFAWYRVITPSPISFKSWAVFSLVVASPSCTQGVRMGWFVLSSWPRVGVTARETWRSPDNERNYRFHSKQQIIALGKEIPCSERTTQNKQIHLTRKVHMYIPSYPASRPTAPRSRQPKATKRMLPCLRFDVPSRPRRFVRILKGETGLIQVLSVFLVLSQRTTRRQSV